MSLVALPLLLALGGAPSRADPAFEGWLQSVRGELGPNAGASLKPRTAPIPKAKGDVREVYAKVAPATVLIRTQNGFGSGVVINAKGYILTNHHVIAAAVVVGFKQRVGVELGRLDEDGVMQNDGKARVAWVLKSDPLIDLAVIKLEDPPTDLHAVKVAAKDPTPGEPVAALGHGSIGLMWAIKDGEISSIGRLATHLALLVGSECQVSTDPTVAEACKKSRPGLEQQRKGYAERVPGLVIQSSCTISPGDSGGPLVNRSGELVGVNAFLRSDGSAPVATNFHVHVKEVRKFLGEVPAEPVARMPDPWVIPHGVASLVDSDGDGIRETLLVRDGQGVAAFVDLEQHNNLPPGAWADSVWLARLLKANLAVRKVGDRLAAFYDLDGDGRFERVHLKAADGTLEAFTIAENGSMTKLDPPGLLVDPAQLKSEVAKARLKAIGPELTADSSEALPDPLLAAGASGALFDGDHDKKADCFEVRGLGGLVTLLDLSQSQFPTLTAAEASKLLATRALHPRVSFAEHGSKLWAFFDTDSDGHFDLVVATADSSAGGIEHAWSLTPAGALGKERPELIGALIGRPLSAYGLSAVEAARYVTVLRALKVPWEASTRTTSAVPHPVYDVGFEVVSQSPPTAGFSHALISVAGHLTASASSLLFDLDRDAQKAKTPVELERQAAQGAFPAEFSWIQRGTQEWFSYDTNHDGTFDKVLFRAPGVSAALSLDGKGVWTSGPDPGARIRPELFADPGLKAALTALAPQYFNPDALRP